MNRNKTIIFIFALVAMVLITDACFAQDAGTATAAAHSSWAEDLYYWFKDHMNYWTILVLMAIESSVIPLPSEVVVPPAAYFSLQANSSLDFWVVILVATAGAYLGSAINYGLSLLIGRPIIYAFADSKVGHFLRLSKEKMEKAEQYFQKKGFFAQLEHYNHYLKIAGFALLGLVIIYIIYKVMKNKKKNTVENSETSDENIKNKEL